MKQITLKSILAAALLACTLGFNAKADSRVALTVDGKEISADEFSYLYSKNTAGTTEKTTPREYAAMFALFKMKVHEAEAAGLDTLPQFKAELQYYCSTLEPQDTMLRNEYRDGMLLFEISNRTIWQPALASYEALGNHFEANRDKFAWSEPRAKGWIIFAHTDDMIQQATDYLQSINAGDNTNVPVELLIRFGNELTANRFLVKQGVNPLIDSLVFNDGKEYLLESKWKCAGTFACRIIEQPEEWTDVKGNVTADYQQLLNREWESQLLEHHTVHYNYEVIDGMDKN